MRQKCAWSPIFPTQKMNTRFTKNAKIFDICITAVAGMVSVCVMLYGVAARHSLCTTTGLLCIGIVVSGPLSGTDPLAYLFLCT